MILFFQSPTFCSLKCAGCHRSGDVRATESFIGVDEGFVELFSVTMFWSGVSHTTSGRMPDPKPVTTPRLLNSVTHRGTLLPRPGKLTCCLVTRKPLTNLTVPGSQGAESGPHLGPGGSQHPDGRVHHSGSFITFSLFPLVSCHIPMLH